MPAPFACTPSMFHSEECAVLKVGVRLLRKLSHHLLFLSYVVFFSSNTQSHTDGNGWRMAHPSQAETAPGGLPFAILFCARRLRPGRFRGHLRSRMLMRDKGWAILCFALTSPQR